jgi:hypothetical protein
MSITISFDPNDASDVEYVQALLGGAEEAPAPAPKKAAPKKAAAKAAEPEPEPEEEAAEDEGVTLQACIDKATELVSEGRAAEVKGALANLGVKRVGELEESQYEEFFAAISEDSPV